MPAIYVINQILPNLDDPPIVDVLEGITGDLLLMTGASLIRVFQRIDVFVRVKPARWLTERVTQRYLRSDPDEWQLPFNDR